MATAKKCDRCGKYYEGRINRIEISTPCDFGYGDTLYDLCDDCLDKFNIFMNNSETDEEFDAEECVKQARKKDWRAFLGF